MAKVILDIDMPYIHGRRTVQIVAHPELRQVDLHWESKKNLIRNVRPVPFKEFARILEGAEDGVELLYFRFETAPGFLPFVVPVPRAASEEIYRQLGTTTAWSSYVALGRGSL